jgi:hypothetical protein
MIMSNSRIESSLALSDWMGEAMERCSGIADGRVELTLTCYYAAWQHHAAISRSLKDGLVAPATALLRCLYEALVRGMWLHRGARDEQLAAFRAGDRPPGTEKMIERLQEVDLNGPNGLLKHHERSFDLMCDWTHTGISQLRQHWQSGGDICAQLSAEDEGEVLWRADTYALWALADAAVIAKSDELAREALSKMRPKANQGDEMRK